MIERRWNIVGRWIVRQHQRYCTTWQVRLVWSLMIVTMILQVLLVALARP